MSGIEIIVRAVILKRQKIMLCRLKLKKANWCFLPGGHVQLGEKITKALRRELQEELKLSIQNPRFIGAVENFYGDSKGKHHEINLVFATKPHGKGSQSTEGHIRFEWVPLKYLPKAKILPTILKKCLMRWLKDQESFWVSQK